MKLIQLLSICLLFLVQKTNAQSEPSDGFADYILYKNGSRVYGKVLYYIPSDTLTFQLQNGQILRCPPAIIKSVQMAKPKITAVESPKTVKPYEFREHGFYGSAAYAMSFGRDKNGSGTHTGVGFQASAGHLFNRKLGIGGGIGYDGYYLKDGNANVLSAFGEVRGYFSKRNFSEYYTFAVGYGQPQKTDNQSITKKNGGLLLQPTIGIRLGASPRYNFFVELGARFQEVNYEYKDQWIENKYKVSYQRWILRCGILF